MTGLKYILELNNINGVDIANELNICKQNFSYWVAGTRKIPKRYLQYLVQKFNVPEDFLQAEIDIIIQYNGINVDEYLNQPNKTIQKRKTDLSEYTNEELLLELSKRLNAINQ